MFGRNEVARLRARVEEMGRRLDDVYRPLNCAPMRHDEILARLGGPDSDTSRCILALAAGIEAEAVELLAQRDTTPDSAAMLRGEVRACKRLGRLLNACWDEQDRVSRSNVKAADG